MFKEIKPYINKEDKCGTPLWRSLLLEYRLPWRYRESILTFKFRKIKNTPPLECNPQAETQIHSLICHPHLNLYLAAIKSFLRYYTDVSVVVHDDGSLTISDIESLKKHIGGVKIFTKAESNKLATLKLSLYLKNMRKIFSLNQKLIDIIFLGKNKKIIIMDCDIFFVKRPDEAIDWIRDDKLHSFYIAEPKCNEKKFVNKMIMHPNINTGFIGFRNDVTVGELEDSLKSLERNEPFNIYFLEQCVYSAILKKRKPYPLDRPKYVVYIDNSYSRGVKMIHFAGPYRFRKNRYLKLVKKLTKELKIENKEN